MDLGFKGKVALVTGAGSQIGFGKAIALLLAKEGCDAVAVNDINLDDAKKTADAIKALGKKSIAIKADVTKKAEVQDMVAKALAEFKKIDILCNVAGAILGTGPFDKQSEELWDKEIALNFKAVMLVTQAVIPGMHGTQIRQNSQHFLRLRQGRFRRFNLLHLQRRGRDIHAAPRQDSYRQRH